MSIADKILWVIERNSGQPLTLNAVAAACGVSRSHVANAFGTATGLPVMKYLRARRLSKAAQALAGGAPDILALALDSGYGSHEAFTRAFRDQFAKTPESVRDARSLDGIALVAPLALEVRALRALDPPRMVRQDSVRAVGLSETHTFDTVIRIPAQWQRFMPYYNAIPDKVESIPLGISYAADDEGRFQYVCAVEVGSFGTHPSELLRLEIPARRYAVFEHRGHVSTLFESYATIWNDALPACGCTVADAPTLERHNPTFDPRSGEGGLTLWIPLVD